MKKAVFCLLALALIIAGCTGLPSDRAKIIADAENISTVRIHCHFNYTHSTYGNVIVIDSAGIILTAAHVVANPDGINVILPLSHALTWATLPPQNNFRAEDVAFISINGAGELKPAPLLREKYNPAEWTGRKVYLKGYIPGEGEQIISGTIEENRSLVIVPLLSRRTTTVDWRKIDDYVFVRIDKKDIAGMSGGAIVADGQVIALIVQQWTILGATYAMGVPIYRCLALYHRP